MDVVTQPTLPFYRPNVTLPQDDATCALGRFFEFQARFSFATLYIKRIDFYFQHYLHSVNHINLLIVET